MRIIDNINSLLGDDLKASIHPRANRERSLYGSEFEIQLRNKLTQRAIARECAEWMRRKARFRSNKTKSSMQQFACIQGPGQEAAYMPLHGFTAVDLGYQQGNAVSNIVNRIDETAFTSTYLQLFDQIWSDPTKLEDVTDAICDHIASVYEALYGHLLIPLMPYPARPAEGLQARVERMERIRLKQRELERCDARLRQEKQFNRKVAINAELRDLKQELEGLIS
jgi:hypothetical protein